MTPADKSTLSVRSRARSLRMSGWGLLLVLILIGFGLIASRSVPSPDHGPLTSGPAAAEEAVEALLHPGPSAEALIRLPADFTQVTGVTPAQLPAKDGTVRAVHIDGGCSTPWGEDNTEWDFSVPCKAHDLGYDLLRYAEKRGQPLAPAMREALDNRLSDDMHATCRLNPMNSASSCQVVASIYTAGLVVNSWHQRWGPPNGEPVGPMLAGIAVIGCLIVFRLRDWVRLRYPRYPHTDKPAKPAATPESLEVSEVPEISAPPTPRVLTSWAVLGVSSLTFLVLGEALISVLHWAGVSNGWLWPLTWLAQLAPVFFFAGGQANAAGWKAEIHAGGGYRQYLTHRANWVLRSALIFVLVALLVPLALELLGIPAGTNAAIVRIALHPLWLIGVYLLITIAAPIMMALQQRAPQVTISVLLLITIAAELANTLLDMGFARNASVLGIALLAQQAAFWYRERGIRTPWLIFGALAGATGLILLTTVGGMSTTLLGEPETTPALSATGLNVLALGIVQLSLLGLFARPLTQWTTGALPASLARFALRAPMSLYLSFLAGMLLIAASVSLPGKIGGLFTWLLQPRPLLALILLLAPAIGVFWWFERHRDAHLLTPHDGPKYPGRIDSWLSHTATILGILYAAIGVFGFALTRFGGSNTTTLLGLHLDPIQNLVQLLLGVFLLHAVRKGIGAATSTWVVAAIASLPPVMSAASKPVIDIVTIVVQGGTGLVAILAVAATLYRGKIRETA